MEFDLLIQNDLIMHFENAYNNDKPLDNPFMYDKATVNKNAYDTVISNKNEFCLINTIGGPPYTKWYIYHCNDNKFIFINKVFNYFCCTSTYLWFYCSTIDLLELSVACYGIERKSTSVNKKHTKRYDSLAGFYDIELTSNDETICNNYYVGTDLFDNNCGEIKKIKNHETMVHIKIHHNQPHEDGRLSLIHPDNMNCDNLLADEKSFQTINHNNLTVNGRLSLIHPNHLENIFDTTDISHNKKKKFT